MDALAGDRRDSLAGPASQVRSQGAHLELALALRRLRKARGLSQRALAGPLHLSAHSAIADYEAGRRIPPADVLRGYERFFGVPPGELLRWRARALADRAAREEAAARAPSRAASSRPYGALSGLLVPRQLPVMPSCFVGRDDALARLDQLLAAPARPGAVAVSGMGGVGKTALAVWWAQQHEALFPDGALYVDLRGYDPAGEPLGPAEALEGFLRALGVPTERLPYDVAERAALFRTVTATRRVIIVLDNARNAGQVRPLLPGTGAARAIVTSRDRLAGLTAREGVLAVPLDVLSGPAAAALLHAVTGLAAADERVGQVASLCGRLPLALRVAGERIARDPATGLGRVLDELADSRGRLGALDAGGDEATAVRRVLAWSYDALPAAARLVLLLLGNVSIPEVTAPAAAALTGLELPTAGRLLEMLAGSHLLLAQGGRYALHDLVRCFARETAAREVSEQDLESSVARLAAWYLHSACNARAALAPHLPPLRAGLPAPAVAAASFSSADEALAWCQDERGSLVAATRMAFDHGLYVAAWQLPTALYGFFELRKYWSDWMETHAIALRAARRLGDGEAEGRIWCNLGNAYRPLYQFGKAIECYRRALELFVRVGYRQGQGKVLGNLGTTLHEMGKIAESVQHHELALVIFRDLGDSYGTALTLTNLGAAYTAAGQPGRAMAAHDEALSLFRAGDDLEGEARALSNMGKALAAAGQYAEAVERHEQSVLLFQAAGNRLDQAYALADLMAARFALGEPGPAADYGQRAADLLAELGHDAAHGQVLADLAVVCEAAGDPARAQAFRRQSAAASGRASAAQREAARRLAARLISPASQ